MDKNTENAIYGHCHLIRGSVINGVIGLERIMDIFLVEFFCKDYAKPDFTELIVGSERLSFDAKRQLIETILKRHFTDVYDAKYKKIMRDIELRIIPKRNQFAHYFIDMNYDEEQLTPTPNGVRLSKIKDGKDHVWFSNSDIIELTSLISECGNEIVELLKTPMPLKFIVDNNDKL